MAHNMVIPVILCGGHGLRLWPLSTRELPKPFHRFHGAYSLLQDTLLRCRSQLFHSRPVIVASIVHHALLLEQLSEIDVKAELLLEKSGRDSLGAALAGAMHVSDRASGDMMLLMAADHYIPDVADFERAVAKACPAADKGMLVTFGIRPGRPHEGYGYIKPGDVVSGTDTVHVAQFVEKPDRERAAELIADGWLWNSGNFLCQPAVLLKEAEELARPMFLAIKAAYAGRSKPGDAVVLGTALVGDEVGAVSIDRAIMEKTGRGCVLPVDYRWNDIGTWASVADLYSPDAAQNTTSGTALVLHATGVFVHAVNLPVAVVGVDDVIVVATDAGVLVTTREAAQHVKLVSEAFRNIGSDGTEAVPYVIPPGGGRIDLALCPQDRLLLVSKGKAVIERDAATSSVSHNGVYVIPGNTVCRICNGGTCDLEMFVILPVQQVVNR